MPTPRKLPKQTLCIHTKGVMGNTDLMGEVAIVCNAHDLKGTADLIFGSLAGTVTLVIAIFRGRRNLD